MTGLTNRSSYDFRVAAVNSTGTGGYSTGITSSPFLFADSSIWLSAGNGTNCSTDSCNISSWADQSGKNNSANQATTANQPVYSSNKVNNNPIIEFNSTSQFLQSSTT